MEKSGEDGQWRGLRDIMMLVCGGISGGGIFLRCYRISYKFFLRCSINTSLHLKVEIEFCGCQQGVGYIRFVPIIMPLGVSHNTLFHERAFGVLGSLERCRILCGLQL